LDKIIEKGKTLLVDGPASVAMISGKAEVFGFKVRESKKIVIREGKRLPFAVEETACFNISLGANGDTEEKEDNTIPNSWIEAYRIIREFQKKPIVIMVVGSVDSGKTSLCTYLTNRMVNDKSKVAVIDEDLGQSDIGPPSTVAYAHVVSPVTDLFSLQPENTVFIGTTSAGAASKKTVEGTAYLKKEIEGKAKADLIIINTDGWSGSEEAAQFKSELANSVEPDAIFCLGAKDEHPSVCASFGDALAGFRQERAESPANVKERSREKRKDLRELGFAKYLENARVKVFPLNHVVVGERNDNALIKERKAQNLLIGLYDAQKKFLGIGVLREIDYTRKSMKVQTAVADKPASVVFGKIRLDEKFHEISENAEAKNLTGKEMPNLTGK
jgi:polynucleotide 5'-hydroxyl-kinase GRC3/NOL9